MLKSNEVTEEQGKKKNLRYRTSRIFLRGCFPGAGSDLGGPTHRGRQNHMDRSTAEQTGAGGPNSGVAQSGLHVC